MKRYIVSQDAVYSIVIEAKSAQEALDKFTDHFGYAWSEANLEWLDDIEVVEVS